MQAVFKYTGFDEVKRLGLRDETEVQVRTRFVTAFHLTWMSGSG